MKSQRPVCFGLAAFAFAFLPSTSASALEKPSGEVVLTVTGPGIEHPNVRNEAQFDIAMLEALRGREGTMETPWTEGKVRFFGPLLRSVLEAAGAKGAKLKIVALNDYAAEVPTEDATTLDTILATRMDGKFMSVREKGPLFLVYPFDLDPALFNEKYFSRSVWQIKTIEVLQ